MTAARRQFDWAADLPVPQEDRNENW